MEGCAAAGSGSVSSGSAAEERNRPGERSGQEGREEGETEDTGTGGGSEVVQIHGSLQNIDGLSTLHITTFSVYCQLPEDSRNGFLGPFLVYRS